jgi:outer membrane beta-barrel protein
MGSSSSVEPIHLAAASISENLMRLHLPILLLLFIPCGVLVSGSALAKKKNPDLEETDKLPALQNRLYRLEHEINLGVGVLPVDAFYKGVTFNGGYAWHINDLWAVEGHFSYSKNIKTALRDKLENNFGEPPSKFAEISYYGEVGGLFKPIYGKLSFFNKSLVYGEIFLSLSGVVARMNGGSVTETEPQGKGSRLAFGASPGFGLRGYISRHFSVRFDFRYLLLYSRGEGHYPLTLGLSLAYTTRSDS